MEKTFKVVDTSPSPLHVQRSNQSDTSVNVNVVETSNRDPSIAVAKRDEDEKIPVNYALIRPRISVWIVWFIAFCYLVTGVCSRIFTKWQNRTQTPVSDDALVTSNFNQPFWQTAVMFTGMSFCLPAMWLDQWVARKRSKGARSHGYCEFPKDGDLERDSSRPLYQFLPAILDLGNSVMTNIASTITYVSVVQMLANTSMIMSTLFSLFILKRPVRVHQWMGIAVMTVGMVCASYSAITNPDSSSSVDPKVAWLGILLTIMGQASFSAKIVVEEKIMAKAYCPPLFAVGWQGLWGIIVNVVLIIIIHYSNWYRVTDGFYQIVNNGELLLSNVLYLFITFLYNGIGLMVTAVADSVFRTVINGVRSTIIYLVELMLGWAEYQIMSFVGLVFCFLGFFIYNYLLGINRNNFPSVHRFLRKGCGYGGYPETDSDSDSENEVAV